MVFMGLWLYGFMALWDVWDVWYVWDVWDVWDVWSVRGLWFKREGTHHLVFVVRTIGWNHHGMALILRGVCRLCVSLEVGLCKGRMALIEVFVA